MLFRVIWTILVDLADKKYTWLCNYLLVDFSFFFVLPSSLFASESLFFHLPNLSKSLANSYFYTCPHIS